MSHSTRMLAVMAGSTTPTTPSPVGHDDVDQPMDGWVEIEEEVVTEFQDEEKASLKQVPHVCVPKDLLCATFSDDPLPCVCLHELHIRVNPCKFKILSTLQFLIPGIDNSLSSYINQRSADGKVWRRRWFVLTNRTLVCYENHLVSYQI